MRLGCVTCIFTNFRYRFLFPPYFREWKITLQQQQQLFKVSDFNKTFSTSQGYSQTKQFPTVKFEYKCTFRPISLQDQYIPKKANNITLESIHPTKCSFFQGYPQNLHFSLFFLLLLFLLLKGWRTVDGCHARTSHHSLLVHQHHHIYLLNFKESVKSVWQLLKRPPI